MPAVMAYITCADLEEAERIGGLLVEGRLAACVNIVDGMRSVFFWEGRLDQGRETILLAKTWDDRVEDLTRTVIAAHSYDLPCVLVLPVAGGNPDFIRWIEEQTR